MLAGQRGMLLYGFAKSPSGVEKAKQLVDQAAQQWQKSIDEVRPLLVREDARQVIDRLQEQRTNWYGLLAEVKRLVDQGKPDVALTLATEKGLPIYEANNRDTGRFREMQNEDLTLAAEQGAALGTWSWIVALVVLSLSLVVGVVVLVMVRRMTATLQDAVTKVSQSAVQVASAASEISASSQAIAQGTSEQAASLEETAASSEEITAMTRTNADHSHAAAELMQETSVVVSDANRMFDQMEASMKEINASSEKIGKIIRVIDEIAFQTNILALNAAVEAARAGEAGMGFAVVADEVRNLAQRSAQAAKDTASLIEDSITKSAEGRSRLDHVSTAVQAITEKAQKAKELVDQVNTGSREQARGIEEISKAITQMEHVTQSSAASAEETASAGEEMSSQAAVLKQVVLGLQEMVGVGDAR